MAREIYAQSVVQVVPHRMDPRSWKSYASIRHERGNGQGQYPVQEGNGQTDVGSKYSPPAIRQMAVSSTGPWWSTVPVKGLTPGVGSVGAGKVM